MKNNRLLKLAATLACAACSSCSPEQDADVDESLDVAATDVLSVGMQFSERMEPAEGHDGMFSVYEYKFKGRGMAHSDAEIEKYNLDELGRRGSDVSVDVHIEWPESGSGLTKDALAKVRKAILWMAFVSEMPSELPPDVFGETYESLTNRVKVLCAEEGYEWDDDEGFGLSPADWARLGSDALSTATGRAPAKDDGRVTVASLEHGLSGIKKFAQEAYVCTLKESVEPGDGHTCSQWTFAADVRLDWPFGMEARNGAKQYERPVVCVWNTGYSNDGGNGCHSFYYSKVYSLPDGRELDAADYFKADKLKSLSRYVGRRIVLDNKIDFEDGGRVALVGIHLDDADMLVTKDGVKWTLGPYSYFPGCYGVVSAFTKWEDLREYLK